MAEADGNGGGKGTLQAARADGGAAERALAQGGNLPNGGTWFGQGERRPVVARVGLESAACSGSACRPREIDRDTLRAGWVRRIGRSVPQALEERAAEMETPYFSNNLLPGEGKARKLNKLTRWERGNEKMGTTFAPGPLL